MARLLFIGDSLIEYFDWERRFPNHTVHNLGVAGETVEGLYARLPRIFASIAAPEMVFIMSGINNMALGSTGFIDTYREMLQEIRRAWPSAAVIVHSLLPVLFPYIANEDIRKMNEQLKHLASDEQARFLDIHKAFLDKEGRPVAALLDGDGVHVSEEGYRIWSAAIEKLLVT